MSSSTYSSAREAYAAIGVDTEAAIRHTLDTPISLHCWQGDDVAGFEGGSNAPGGGLAVTGNYPGRATTIAELRDDLQCALDLLPGSHRLNLHAIYGDFSAGKVDRDAIELRHFQSWVDWCGSRKLGIDFNPTCFAHPLAADGWTLAHPDPSVRAFWVEHCRRSRRIGAAIGKQLGSATVTNVWVPDGMKDTPVDRFSPRQRLSESLDAVFADRIEPEHAVDAVESKLFGIGSESYVVGSHEFYLSYAIRKQIWICLDNGHFHPTESVADKISAIHGSVPGLLLHLSRGLRWDSDHIVTLNNEIEAIVREVVQCNEQDRMRIGLDYFDASVNRVAAWVIGARAAKKALLRAHLQPQKALREAEQQGDYTARLCLQEASHTLPFGAIWEELCRHANVPGDLQWLDGVRNYERTVLSKR